MSDSENRINELMGKMQLLLDQQAVFSKEIEALKAEVEKVSSTKVPETTTVEEKVTTVQATPIKTPLETWPDSISLDMIKKNVPNFEERSTNGGIQFVQFLFKHQENVFIAKLAANANWIVQTESGNLIAKGKFTNNGLTLKSTEGGLVGQLINEDSIIKAVLKAAGFDEKVISTPIAKTINKPTERKSKSAIEKYIGENLIAVLAAVIILIGVVFGVKYSIDHELISPVARVILSYVLGIVILGFGIKTKQKYEQFSAVLVSTSMAIMYFTTFGAYSFYGLIPQTATFAIMVLFTVFIVFAAIKYDRQIIAHIGLVGSYAIPFLLSNGSGQISVLFTYMAIINAGILILGFKRNWKPLYYVAFGATWFIFAGWFLGDYQNDKHFILAILFATVYFIMFYATFLAYKLIEKEKFSPEDFVMILLNSSVFYGFTYACLDGNMVGRDFVGLFTLATALSHFAVSVIIFKTKLADRNLFYLSSGMVLVFITIAIPVQLDGTWVTLLWGVEAAILFWIGRTKSVVIYERLAYPVMAIALSSLVHDWLGFYNEYSHYSSSGSKVDLRVPFFNITFLTSILMIASFSLIYYFNKIKEYRLRLAEKNQDLLNFISVTIPGVLIVLVYFAFSLELNLYWAQVYNQSAVNMEYKHEFFGLMNKDFHNQDILKYKSIWLINYSLVFLSVLTFINMKKTKNETLGKINVLLNLLGIVVFLTVGLYQLSALRESYINQPGAKMYDYGAFNIGIRYISYTFLGILLYLSLQSTKHLELFKIKLSVITELIIHTVILWVLSSELINILDLSGSNEQHKLGLSILAGLYSFMMVGIGIWKKKQYIRIAAFSLFGLVLVKLFLYDIAQLTTIAKTVVFISLGVILLVISYMYNKFKDQINDEN
jgi:hypothetical protein